MSRGPSGGTERLDRDRDDDRVGGAGRPAARARPRPWSCITEASANRRRSTDRCHTPCRPGRFSAASESSQIAPGRGHSSAAVIEQ